ncbi:MAG: glycosyltransferase family 2 protein [Burkholderiaceae bacterium]
MKPSGRAESTRHRHAVAWLLAVCAVALQALAWWALHRPQPAPDAPARVAGLAYNAFGRWDSPITQRFPEASSIESDLQQLAGLTSRLRTYSASEFDTLPAQAEAAGLNLTAGIWLDTRLDHNEREITAALRLARSHRGIERLIVGNEVLLRGDLERAELSRYLDRVRARSRLPVSTAEPWHVWLANPQLVRHVDFITVHLLPYWEGVPVEHAVDYAFMRLAELRQRFPNKPVVIGEIGWPSAGERVGGAVASPAAQARFVREFLQRSADLRLDYFLMEAVDQPWKQAEEGVVGAHWGLWDAQRQPKFDFTGEVNPDPHWHAKAALSGAVAFALLLPLLLRLSHLRLRVRVLAAAGGVALASLWVHAFSAAWVQYLRAADVLWLALLVPASALLVALVLAQWMEFAELFWRGGLPNRLRDKRWPADQPAPRVSIHLACCNEDPRMVIATIDSLMALRWPSLEILVVDNNTRDVSRWQPVQAHVQRLQARLAVQREAQRAVGAQVDHSAHDIQIRFFHLPRWPGFKAGALNFALQHTDPAAQWVAVVDADYVVHPDWLQRIAGHFADPQVAVVQCPQAHRDWQDDPLQRMMNWEYDSFFRVGMHHRFAREALIQHGTMTTIRTRALREVGGWDEDCICEDTELGLRLLQAGWRVLYLDRVLGTGLVPADFAAYRRQRQRWAQGGMQILRKHWRALLGQSRLTLWQRYHFVAGWLPWWADAAHSVFAAVAIGWGVGWVLAPASFTLPPMALTASVAVLGLARLAMLLLLLRRCVTPNWRDALGTMLAGAALSHAVGMGVWRGLWQRRAVFHVTRKAGDAGGAGGTQQASAAAVAAGATDVARARPQPRVEGGTFADGLLLTGLVGTACAVWWAALPHEAAAQAFAALLLLQATPHAAACVCSTLAGRWVGKSRHNLRTA